MDIVSTCLNATPVPALGAAWSIFRLVWQSIQNYKSSNIRLETLAYCLAQLLCTVDANAKKSRSHSLSSQAALQISELERLLSDVSSFVEKTSNETFLKWLLRSRDRDLDIDGFHKRISACVSSFQIASLIDITEWQRRYESAAAADRVRLDMQMVDLMNDQRKLRAVLESQLRVSHGSSSSSSRDVVATDMPRALESFGDKFFEEERYVEAEKAYSGALGGYEATLGNCSLDTLRAMHNLGVTLNKQGRNREAQKLLEECLSGREELLGPEHMHSLWTLHALGDAFFWSERYPEAERSYARVLAGYRASNGELDLDTLQMKYNKRHDQ